jgi:Immunity protein 26
MSARKKKLQVGDVFTIPLRDEIVSLGQIIKFDKDLFIVVYGKLFSSNDRPPNSVDTLNLVAASYTTDEFFCNKKWSVIGSQEPDLRAPRPSHIVDNGTGLVVIDFAGSVVRQATDADQLRLSYMKVISANLIATLIRDICGIEKYPHPYGVESVEYITVDEVLTRS